MLLVLACASLCLAAPASLSGVVRNVAGEPQMGAEVELLRADLSVVAMAMTDSHGRYEFASVQPGRYSIKAVCHSFLPTLRENLRVRTGSVVNLTMSTLYEAMQWLPTEPRKADAQSDDWAWTLRTAANRPLLRWLEDGPLVVVDGGRGSRKLKARLVASGQDGSFGESGERFSATVEDTPTGSRELLARVDFAPGSDAGMESMLGFRQELGYVGAVQSLATVSVHPEISGPSGAGLAMAAMRNEETIQLGDLATINAGATAVLARMQGSGTARATLPSLEIRWSNGGTQALRYRLASQLAGGENGMNLPRLALRNNRLAVEHGLHQEFGWERTTESSGLRVAIFADRLENPILEASGADADGGLVDSVSGLARYTGENFSTTGVEASFEHQLKGGNRVRLSYANGDALVMSMQQRASSAEQIALAARPHRTQTYALTLSGTLEGSGTRWRASYRWQPDDAVTAVAPYALNAASPYLNLHLRQPVRLGSTSFEALFDMQNLLAQGYRPYLMTDGSLLLFAQGQRAVRAGLAFNF
jgi:hypothetical protein